jgi:spermidine synthase
MKTSSSVIQTTASCALTATGQDQHAIPFVVDGFGTKALHFTEWEVQSRMILRQPNLLCLEYTRRMMGFMLFNSRPRSILMIGLGGGSLAKFCHRYLPDTSVTVVERNPHVIALRDEFYVPKDDRRFKIIEADGAHFVRDASSLFDIVLLDGFDAVGQPEQLSSQRFYDNCWARMSLDGILVSNLHAANPGRGMVVSRLRNSFGHDPLEVGTWGEGNIIAFVGKGDAIAEHRFAALRRPGGLDATAWQQMKLAFGPIIIKLQRGTQQPAQEIPQTRHPGAPTRSASNKP